MTNERSATVANPSPAGSAWAPLIAVTDGLKGIGEALGAVFPAKQTCIVHLIRNSLVYAGWRERKLLAAALKPIYTACSAEAPPRRSTNSSVAHEDNASRRWWQPGAAPGIG